jgi:hypothetical protein
VAAVRLAGFLVLLAVIFAWAHVVGGMAGPAGTGHSRVRSTGGGTVTDGTGTGGMDMGGRP